MIKKTIFIGLIISTIATGVALLLAEYFVRKYNPQDTYDFIKSRGLNINEKGDNIPITLKKNVKDFRHVSGTVEFSALVSTNSFGLRSPEIQQEKPNNTYRILLLGDSMTFGWGVNNDETFGSVLENKLNGSGTNNMRFEVLNAAFTAGKSVDTYYIYLKEQGLKFEPDLVIINHFPFNDYTDLSEVEWAETDKDSLPTKIISKDQTVENGYVVASKNRDWKYVIPILRNSHAAILLMKFVERESPTLTNFLKKPLPLNEQSIDGVYGPYSSEVQYCLSVMSKEQCNPGFYGKILDFQKLILATHQLLSERSVDMLVTIFPWPEQLRLMKPELEINRPIEDFNPNKRIRAFLEENQIDNYDFLPSFAYTDVKVNFYDRDGHYNKNGNQVVADKLYDLINEKYLEQK